MKPKRLLRRFWRRSGKLLPDWLLDEDARSMRRIAQEVGKNDVVIDLGAHVGNATVEFAQTAKHVYAFEPNPVNFRELAARTRRYPNVTIFEKAVSDKTGTTRLYFEQAKPGHFFEGSTILEGKSNIGYGKHHEVETISIAEVMNMIGEPVALIKMDIEGAEYTVLDALLAADKMDDVGKIYVECHVDRIAGLEQAKAKTLAAMRAAGVMDKLSFEWP